MDKKQLQLAKTRPAADLGKEARDLRDRLWTLKNDLASGKVKNVREIRTVKKSIAQLLTLIRLNTKN